MSHKAMKQWLSGLISAAASGAMGVLGMNIIDPGDFNFDHTGKLFAAASVCALIGIVNYLAKSPLPPDDDCIDTQRFQEKP